MVTVDPRLSVEVIVDTVGVRDVVLLVVGVEVGVEDEVVGVELVDEVVGVEKDEEEVVNIEEELEVVMMELLVVTTDEDDSVVGTEVGLLLAIELDDGEGAEELEVGDGACVDVDGTPVSVLVELEAIVNCLNTSFLGCLYIAMSVKRRRMAGRCYIAHTAARGAVHHTSSLDLVLQVKSTGTVSRLARALDVLPMVM